jgi:hypothetical protein
MLVSLKLESNGMKYVMFRTSDISPLDIFFLLLNVDFGKEKLKIKNV